MSLSEESKLLLEQYAIKPEERLALGFNLGYMARDDKLQPLIRALLELIDTQTTGWIKLNNGTLPDGDRVDTSVSLFAEEMLRQKAEAMKGLME